MLTYFVTTFFIHVCAFDTVCKLQHENRMEHSKNNP